MTNWHSLSAQSRGILFLLACVLVMSLMDAIGKLLGTRVDVSQVVLARFGGHLLLMLVIFGPRRRLSLRSQHPWLQLMRSLLQLGAAGFFFTALQTQGLAAASAVADMNPVLITLGAAILLGEKVGWRRAISIAAAFGGALLIIRPGTAVFSLSSIWPFGTALCFAGYALLTRMVGTREPPLTGLFYTGVICTAAVALIAPFRWEQPDALAWGLMALMGSLGFVGQLFLMRAYAEGDASAIAPFAYTGLIAASFWGIIFFDQWPDIWTVLGALVIVGSGLYVWHRETRTQTAQDTDASSGER
nr:DMT family transporter [uncultured Celeribacter sp.]